MSLRHYITTRMRPEPSALTADQMRRGQRRIIIASCVSILFWTGINDRIIGLFILKVNPAASDATLAFFFALGPVMAVLTALASPSVAVRGKKGIMVPLYLVGAPFLAVLALVPYLAERSSPGTVVAVAALALTGFAVFRSIGMAGWFPLLNDNIPDDIRGRFFGRLRTSWQLAVVCCTALVGWFLGHRSELWRFQVVFAIGMAANVAMSFTILRIPEAPLDPSPARRDFWRALAEPFRDRPYAYFLLFGFLVNLATGMAGPFALRCLKSTLGAGDNFIVWMDTAASVGAAAALPLWGKMVDRFGGRAVFALLVPLLAVVNLQWLFASPVSAHWRQNVAVFYVLQGSLVFGIGVGVTDMMLGGARKGLESTYINIAFVLNTVAIGMGPFLGTAVARAFAGVEGQWGPLVVDANRWVFVCRFLLLLGPLWLINRLSREHGGHVGEALQRLTGGLLNMLPSIRRGNPSSG